MIFVWMLLMKNVLNQIYVDGLFKNSYKQLVKLLYIYLDMSKIGKNNEYLTVWIVLLKLLDEMNEFYLFKIQK